MNHSERATELWEQWERKEISDFRVMTEYKKMIHELSDDVIRMKTEKAEIQEKIYNLEYENYLLKCHNAGDVAVSYDNYIRYLQRDPQFVIVEREA